MARLHVGLSLLALTGVEDRLADHVPDTLAIAAMARLHVGLSLLALTGVEDRLADHVPDTLAMLTKAGIKVREC
ncbi:unnamed protein product [Plutella xylostella]|uniref:(diamondback moth) hypothetical protein n=1 Tax=Plutella xylostella TaxID=51655 RepID=A0A8S4G8G5_PLUXY|nr:unnamed protein product [Plutella xylostella]